jgi:hypothetical protein
MKTTSTFVEIYFYPYGLSVSFTTPLLSYSFTKTPQALNKGQEAADY